MANVDGTDNTDIAIIGMAIRVPGASTPEEYWANLAAGVESVHTYSDEELLARGVPQATLTNPRYVKSGIPLQDVDQFDPEFFGFSPKEGAILDPQHRHFYEVSWEALERAGHPPASFDGAIAVFAGCGMGAYFTFNLLSNPDLVDSVGLFLLRHTGNDKDFLATRVSYAFNLKGPSVNVQTACSTSLVATHLAVQSLLAGECDMALAGGVTIEVPHQVGYLFKEGEVLSPDGHCRTFDHRSKGTVFGSGAGVVVLRRLSDALADGDHIYAIIKGSAVNNDGSGKVGYLAPSVDGQAAAVAEALAVANVPADSLTYVECHGTATPVGDPIEIAALTRAFRESSAGVGYCRVGSVKTNIGHLDTAAGVASLIKATLALEHKQVPPSLNFEAPNPVIDFANSPFTVAAALSDWEPGATPRRAGVNSLGVGGTNAFLVLEEAPPQPASPADDSPQLLMLSARNRRSLDDAAMRLAAWLRNNPQQSLADVAYTLQAGRHGFDQRRVLTCSSREEAAALLESNDVQRVFTHSAEVEHPSLVFMYPGGGAQYFQMGLGLYRREPIFRDHIDRGLAVLKSRFRTDLTRFLLAPDDTREEVVDQLAKPAIQLPLTFLIEYALTKLWEHYGVTPATVIGHSMGENTAACVAGVFSFEDALGLLLLRGQLVEQAPPGGMLSVPMPASELREMLGDDLDLAASNSPQLSVASGPSEALDRLAAQLSRADVESRRVKVSVAAHSRLLDGILDQFRAYLAGIKLNKPTLEIISNRTGMRLDPAAAQTPDYWVEHLRNTVLFTDGVASLLKSPDRVFLEVGPGNMLGSFVRQHPQVPGQRVLSSMRHPDDPVPDDVYFRTAMGRLWAVGVPLAPEKLQRTQRQRVPLPTYAFQHARYWIDPGRARALDGNENAKPMRLPEIRDWYHQTRWVQQGILESSDEVLTWLVFHAREPLAEALIQRLRAAGHTVVTVQAGDAFARLDPHSYTLAAEAGGAGYQDLVEALVQDDLVPNRILHSWLVTWDQSFRPGSTFFHRNQEYGFYSLFYLARALGKSGVSERDLHLLVIGNGAQRVGTEPLPHPDKATVLGPCAVIPREFPNISCRFVDVDLNTAEQDRSGKNLKQVDSALLEQLEAELSARPVTGVVAWRDGVRWERHVHAQREKNGNDTTHERLRHSDVYLITGGLGGIGGEIAAWLAKTYAARLVLIGRTPLPSRDDWNDWLTRHGTDDSISRAILKIRQLENAGGTVLPLAADVTVAEQMQEAITAARNTFGEINGVFHAAGVIRDNLIQLKSPRDIEEVFSAKIYGTVVLDEIFRRSSLDFMVLFSSTSAFIAPQGQIDYVGANSFVNAFAESCRDRRPYPVTAINWGIWKDVGMVAPTSPVPRSASTDAEIAHASIAAVRYPLFDRRYTSRDGYAQLHVIDGSLSTQHHWLVDEHRLGNGEALLPGTGYIELIRASLAEIGDDGPWELSNLVFQSALFVQDGERRGFRVRLRGDERKWDVTVYGKSRALDAAERWEPCATAKVSRGVSRPPEPIREASIAGSVSSAAGSGALRTRQEDHLKFGPRWRVLKHLTIGHGEALAQLHLPKEYVADLDEYGLHPALLDIATGYAMDLIPGYVEQDVAQNLWVPIGYRRISFHAPLPEAILSKARVDARSSVESGFASFDVQIFDMSGNPLVEVEQLTLRRTDDTLQESRTESAGEVTQGVEGEPVVARSRALSPAEQALRHNITQGIGPDEGIRALAHVLAGPMPATVIVSSMALGALMQQAQSISQVAAQSDDARFARPELDSDFEPPRDEIEKSLAELWGKLLGVEGIGIRDSFFDLGGHSLIAVRLFNEISERYDIDLPMSVLMQSSNIESLAELIRGGAHTADATEDPRRAPSPQFRHVVPMHSGPVGGRTPLFIVAGMFGNVLNLSHLAHLLGEERPFYALQARGLYGDAEPHETFEEMASDYLVELREIQPHGPYLLGGFSGGGLIAFEMARQLLEQGERVLTVLMLDTPARKIWTFGLADRLSLFLQGVQAGGVRFLGEKIRRRLSRETEQQQGRMQGERGDDGGLNFQSQRIGDAFMRALARYRVPKVPVAVAVFRPKLEVRYRLSGERLIDGKRNLVAADNGWTPYVSKLQVFEVPGNHDSMVLEPNVRVMVSLVRRAIEAAERSDSNYDEDEEQENEIPVQRPRVEVTA